jgi:hypothetical protein
MMQRDEALKFLNIMLPMISLNMERDGHLMPVAFMLVSLSPETGERLPQPSLSITPLPWKSQEEKLYMQDQLKLVAQRYEAVLVILATEAWYADGLPPEKVKEADAYVEEHGSLEHFPGVGERIIVRLEYSTTAEFWEANIERVEGHVHVDAFENTVKDLPASILNTGVDNPTLTN